MRQIGDNGAGNAAFGRGGCGANLGNHAAGDEMPENKVLDLLGSDHALRAPGDADARHIGEKNQMGGAQGDSQGLGHMIRIDIVAQAVIAQADGGDDRHDVSIHQQAQAFGVHSVHLAHAAQIRSFHLQFFHPHHPRVNAVQANGLDPAIDQPAHHPHIGDAAQGHFHQAHGLLAGHAQAVDEVEGHAQLIVQPGDFLAAAMHNHGTNAIFLDFANGLDHLGQKLAIVDLTAADFDDVNRSRFGHKIFLV